MLINGTEYNIVLDADLQDAYLQGANLRGANLRGANLRGANLWGAANIARLPVGDPRGYDAIAVEYNGQWIIGAGCQWLLIEDALTHWGEAYTGDREIGDRYLYAINWLIARNGAGE